jgi:hypothetical protein
MLGGVLPKIIVGVAIASVVILIGVGLSTDFFATQNQRKSLNLRSIGDITATPGAYTGKRVTVEGYYYQGDLPKGVGYVTAELVQPPIVQGSFKNIDFLIMNYSRVNITIYYESTLYYFTGILLAQNSTLFQGRSYALSLESIEQP